MRQKYMPSHEVPLPGKIDSLESKVGTNPSEEVNRVRTEKQGGRNDLRFNESQLEEQLKTTKAVQ